jgi:polyhydroxyalkanoate synthase subunit PhaC
MMDVALNAFSQVQFEMSDVLRRAQGHALGALGLGPSECPYQITASGPFWRLRDYGNHAEASSVFIIAAPIKRPYIWDLSPSASAIRHCMQQGMHVRLLEWLPASQTTNSNGLSEYTEVIGRCVAQLSGDDAQARPFLVGHSLGGTLAAIFGAVASEAIRGLVLLGAPLCFQSPASRFRDALVSLVPSGLSDAEPCPGSLLSCVSALALPDTFIWARLADAALSLFDSRALEIHARVERWALDEAPLPGKLVHQLVDWVYREDRFCRGELMIGGKLIGPHCVSAPTLAIVNTSDDVAPRNCVEPFINAMATRDVHIIEYPGELGVGLQHLAVLIGQEAYAQIWPKIFTWIGARG